MKKYINPILSLGTAAALLGAIYFQTQQIDGLKKQLEFQPVVGGDIQKAQTIDSLQNVIDSVRDEIMPLEVELSRYEMTLELLKEEDKKAADKFELILTTQTE
jgi:hypothetical protein